MSLPILRKINSPEERLAVIQAAKNDNDMMHFPTHVLIKDNQIAGSWCIAAVPFLAAWHNTQLMQAKDTLVAINTVSSIMNDRNSGGYFTSCNSNSPMFEHMERFGYQPIWPTNLFYRDS